MKDGLFFSFFDRKHGIGVATISPETPFLTK